MATEEEKQRFVNTLVAQIDNAVNGPELPGIDNKKVGFVLMLFPMGAPPHVGCTITTNTKGTREDIAMLLHTQALMLNPPKPEEPAP